MFKRIISVKNISMNKYIKLEEVEINGRKSKENYGSMSIGEK